MGAPRSVERDVIGQIRGWAERTESVRAALLTGSRARRAAPVDELSDYDVELYLDDPSALIDDDAWLTDFGDVLVSIPETIRQLGRTVPTRLALYRAGHRIDFTLSTTEILRVLATLPELLPSHDAGYEVLVDKDGLTGTMVPPSGRGFAGRPPSGGELLAEVREFWWEAAVVAKELARGELLAAGYSSEAVMRHRLLLRMLERVAETRSGWARAVGPVGRRALEGLAGADTEELRVASRVAEGGAASWRALGRLMDAYSAAAREVCAGLGIDYPTVLESRVRSRIERLSSPTSG